MFGKNSLKKESLDSLECLKNEVILKNFSTKTTVDIPKDVESKPIENTVKKSNKDRDLTTAGVVTCALGVSSIPFMTPLVSGGFVVLGASLLVLRAFEN